MSNMVPFGRNHRSLFNPASLWDMESLFPQIWGNAGAFRVDVRETKNSYEVEADLPGVEKNNIDITVNDDVLTICANMNNEHREEKDNYVRSERVHGCFSRSFNLEGIRADEISAEYENGVLRVHLPKRDEPEKPQRRIEIR